MLTEQEVFDCLKHNLRIAAQECDAIAKYPKSGPAFIRMREALSLAEGACRQAAHWRIDARWLQPGLKLEEAHQRARAWLHRPSVQSKKLFTKLAESLRAMLAQLEQVQTARTGRVGPILPKPRAADGVRSRPVQVKLPMSPGGIILPA